MGYYTTYDIDVIDDHTGEIKQELIESFEYNPFEDSCKWYDHETDMRKFSTKYPNNLFKLIGVGEESGDIWVKYFKDGKMQVCKAIITFDDFNEDKLN